MLYCNKLGFVVIAYTHIKEESQDRKSRLTLNKRSKNSIGIVWVSVLVFVVFRGRELKHKPNPLGRVMFCYADMKNDSLS